MEPFVGGHSLNVFIQQTLQHLLDGHVVLGFGDRDTVLTLMWQGSRYEANTLNYASGLFSPWLTLLQHNTPFFFPVNVVSALCQTHWWLAQMWTRTLCRKVSLVDSPV